MLAYLIDSPHLLSLILPSSLDLFDDESVDCPNCGTQDASEALLEALPEVTKSRIQRILKQRNEPKRLGNGTTRGSKRRRK